MEGRRRQGDRGVPRAPRLPTPSSCSSATGSRRTPRSQRRWRRPARRTRTRWGRRSCRSGWASSSRGSGRPPTAMPAGHSSRPSERTSATSRPRCRSSRRGQTASTITRAAVEELAVGRAETPIFAVTDSWGSRDVAGDAPGDGIAARALAPPTLGRADPSRRLARRSRRPRPEGRAFSPTRASVRAEIASRLKMHPFVAEKSARQARNFSAEELAQAMVRLAELDAGAKGGSRLPADLQLERTLVEITRPNDTHRAK